MLILDLNEKMKLLLLFLIMFLFPLLVLGVGFFYAYMAVNFGVMPALICSIIISVILYEVSEKI